MSHRIMKYRKSDLVDGLSFLFIFTLGALSGYIEHKNLWGMIAIFDLLLAMLAGTSVRRGFKRDKFIIYIWLLLFSFLVCFNIICTGKLDRAIINLCKLFGGIAIVMLISLMCCEKDNGAYRLLNKMHSIIELFGLLNLIVLTCQVNIHGFMIKSRWLDENPYYPDLCAGIFGFNATHELTFFFIFWMIYDIYYALFILKALKRCIQLLFVVLMSFWMLLLSTKNDNMALFGIYAFVLFAFLIMYEKWKHDIGRRVGFLKFFPLLGGLFLVVILNPTINEFIHNQVFRRLSDILSAVNNPDAIGSAERLAIVQAALKHGGGWGYGLGIGAYDWTGKGEQVLGFMHFGINSISSFITLGGIGFYIVCDLMISWFLWRTDKNTKDYLYFVFVIIFITVGSIYTAIFTSYVTLTWSALLIVVFSMMKNKIQRKI